MLHGMKVRDLNAWYNDNHVLKNINLHLMGGKITALIGPSGCGKSTFIRCLNRMHEVIRGGRVRGEVWLEGENIYGRRVDAVMIRRRIGMVFQKPNPFPTMSILENAVSGVCLHESLNTNGLAERAEEALRQAALWEEVKYRLDDPAVSLSGGQQQRLCIARALAVKPEVLLMDEPCSALDPASTLRIEELMAELKKTYTVIIVTHNMQQAARVADHTAFVYQGEVVEDGPTSEIFTAPKDPRTEGYITGRFG